MSFFDEFIRMKWVFLIKFKHKVFVEFKKFRIKVENQSSQKMKVLRTDGGGEYKCTEFRKFYEENGIKNEVTAPYTSQHNRLAKKRNRTLVDMTRSMLKDNKLPHTLWREAVATETYVPNKCPIKK